jgi:hypothetical protein
MKTIITSIIVLALACAGCKNVAVNTPCLVEAGMACAAAFAPCFTAKEAAKEMPTPVDADTDGETE